jgi:hypothetical protein
MVSLKGKETIVTKKTRQLFMVLCGVFLLGGIALAEEPGEKGEGEKRHYLDCTDTCDDCFSASACDNKQVGDSCGSGKECYAVKQCASSACCGCWYQDGDFLAIDDPESLCRFDKVPEGLQTVYAMGVTDLTEPSSIGVPDTGAKKSQRGDLICYARCTGISHLTGERGLCGWGQTDRGCSVAEGGARGACIRLGWQPTYECWSWY